MYKDDFLMFNYMKILIKNLSSSAFIFTI